jgi:FkbM family methyltransferase
MNVTTRAVAEGANRFRQPGFLERLADRFARLPISPQIRRRLRQLYQAALNIQTGGRGLPRELPGGEVVRVFPQYDHLTWNPDEYQAFRNVVKPGMVALDVGASVGAYSLVLGCWVGSTGRVFAFEPEPELFQGLVRHVTLNHLAGIVIPVGVAVSESCATARFLQSSAMGEGRLAVGADVDRVAVTVRTTTIDEFCAKERIAPDFIKIDVEGSELSALRGARKTIRARPGLALFVEMHPSTWPKLGVSLDDIRDELRSQSLEVEVLTPVSDTWAVEGICLRVIGR